MFAWCIEMKCDYATGACESVGEIMGKVVLDGGKLEGTCSICPKCKASNTLMVDIIKK